MATFQLAPDEELVQCPYEVSHQITNLKFLVHLDKCRRNYINKMKEKGTTPDIQHCRFNDAHRYPAIEMEWHQAHCKDQHSVVKHIQYHSSEEFKRQLEEQQHVRQELKRKTEEYYSDEDSDSEEDWDKETGDGYQAGYDPNKKLEEEAILYVPRGLTKSQRKAWRLEHRKKFSKESEMKPDGSGLVYEYDHKVPGLHMKADEDGKWRTEFRDN